MKEVLENIFGFLYTLSMGDYFFLIGTFIIILCFIYILFLINKDNIIENGDIKELQSIKEKIENEYKPEKVILSDYEKEQEDTAIISYDELINKKNKFSLNYDEFYELDNNEVSIKKISYDETGLKEENSKINVKLLNYDKEESFLIALKQLQKNLLN